LHDFMDPSDLMNYLQAIGAMSDSTSQVAPPDASQAFPPQQGGGAGPSKWGINIPFLGGARVTTGNPPPTAAPAAAGGGMPPAVQALGLNTAPAAVAPQGAPVQYPKPAQSPQQMAIQNGSAIGGTMANISKMISKMYGGGMGG
jgi:hypothetical protein